MAVVCFLALVGVVFSSCNKDQESSYPYTVELAPVEQDPSLSMQFELNGLPIDVRVFKTRQQVLLRKQK